MQHVTVREVRPVEPGDEAKTRAHVAPPDGLSRQVQSKRKRRAISTGTSIFACLKQNGPALQRKSRGSTDQLCTQYQTENMVYANHLFVELRSLSKELGKSVATDMGV